MRLRGVAPPLFLLQDLEKSLIKLLTYTSMTGIINTERR